MMQKVLNMNRFTIGLIVVIGISIAAHWQWFIPSGILTASDWWYLPNDVFKEYLTAPKILEGAVDFNPGRFTPTFDLLRVMGGFIAFFAHAFPIWERVFFLWPIALLGPVPIYILLMKRFASPLGATAGSLIYVFNSYILAREISHIHIAVAYLLFVPTILLALDAFLKRPSIKTNVLLTLTTIAFSIYEIRILYIVACILLAYLIARFISKSAQPSYRSLVMIQISVVVIILAQSFWLIPFIFTPSSLGYASFTQRGLFQSFTTLRHAATLADPGWTSNGFLPFTTQPVATIAYTIPVLALLWILVKPRKEPGKDLWFWLALSCIGIFLSAGQNVPFPELYAWIYDHVHGFRLFRESAKFTVVKSFAFSILIAASIAYLERRRKIYAGVGLVLIAIWASSNFIPTMIGKIPDLTTRYTVPEFYQDITHRLQEDTVFSRSLWVPAPQRFVYFSENHPKVDAGTILEQEWKPFIQNASDPYSLFTQPNAKALLNFGSIKYIGVPSDTTKDIYKWFGRTKKGFASLIQDIPGLQQINSPTSEVPLWENKDAKDHIYIANDVTLVDSNVLDFSNPDTNKTGAFIFRPDIPGYLFSLLQTTLATNQEAKPFNVDYLTVEKNTLGTTMKLLSNSKLKTTERKTTQDTLAQVYAKQTDELLSLYAKKDDTTIEIGNFKTASNGFLIKINGKEFSGFGANSEERPIGIARIKPKENRVEIYSKLETSNSLLQDASFEKNVPGEVGDCNNTDGSSLDTNGIAASLVSDATDGEKSLSLAAGNHIGCIFFGINPVTNASLYTIVVDHKSPTGSSGSIRVMEESTPVSELAHQRFSTSPDWQETTINFRTPITNSHKLTAYIYQPGDMNSGHAATSLFDNMRINAYQLLGEGFFDGVVEKNERPLVREFQESDIVLTPSHPYHPSNMVQNGTFEGGNEYIAGDCNNMDQTSTEKNGIAAQIIEEHDNHVLSMKGAKHLACIEMGLSPLDPAFDYLLSMKYKNTQGTPPSITLYAPGAAAVPPLLLPEQSDGEWHEFRTIIQGGALSPSSVLILYVSAEETPSEAVFDDITLFPIPILPDISITSANTPLPKIKAEVRSINPLVHVIKSEAIDRHRLLVFSSRYDEGWRLFVRPQGAPPLSWWKRILRTPPGIQISAQTHIKANAFVNGWVLDPTEIESALGKQALPEFIIEYWPQRFMDAGRTISLATLAVYFGITILLALGGRIPKSTQDKNNQATNSYYDTTE